MEQLIAKNDFQQFLQKENKNLAPFSNFLMGFLQLNKVNKIYSESLGKNNEGFVEAILKNLGISIQIAEQDLEKIPLTGSFITISNHPFGGIDGLILLHILLKRRPDYKVIANFLLKKIEPISEFILPVNPFEERNENSLSGIKAALQTLKNGNPIGIFPAGEVSSIQPKQGITDKNWSSGAIKLIKKAQVPVLPIYFEGNNSLTFHLLGLINPKLRTAKLPSEVFNKKNKVITVRIGNIIGVEDQNACENTYELTNYLRSRTYALKYLNTVDLTKYYFPKQTIKKEIIADEKAAHVLLKEINGLNKSDLLFESETFQLFCTDAKRIPNILHEIARLREITFREVGEGTNKALDIDKYDYYYHHLFMWDKRAQKLVGAYRIGKGAEILSKHGKKGFYVNSLFKLKKELVPTLNQSIELGRSFIIKEYQRQPQPLFLLWKGILYFLIKNPNYRYLIGPVSISNDFTSVSKSLIIEFIKLNYFDNKIAKHIKPRKSYKVKVKEFNIQELVNFTKHDINKLDKMICDLEPDKVRIPVLIKKYIKQNAKIVGFNVDPRFNNALDGLVFLDLLEVPKLTIHQLAKEFNDDTIIDLFYSKRRPKDIVEY